MPPRGGRVRASRRSRNASAGGGGGVDEGGVEAPGGRGGGGGGGEEDGGGGAPPPTHRVGVGNSSGESCRECGGCREGSRNGSARKEVLG